MYIDGLYWSKNADDKSVNKKRQEEATKEPEEEKEPVEEIEEDELPEILGEMKENGLFFEEKSIIIATYILCGFANFSSIGIQIGGISALSPKRKSDLAKIGLKAMFGGAIASWLTATIAGMLL